jgi:hypothetical protein
MSGFIVKASSGNTGPMTGWQTGSNADLPQSGVGIYRCLGTNYSQEVIRRKFQSEEEEAVNVMRLLFGKVENDKEIYLQSKELVTDCAASPRSSLNKLFSSWLGHPMPVDGTFDLDSMIGKAAQISVEIYTDGKGVKRAKISEGLVSPVMPQLEDSVPLLSEFTLPKANVYSPPKSTSVPALQPTANTNPTPDPF